MLGDTIPSMRLATVEDSAPISILELTVFPENAMNETTLANEIEDGECWVEEENGEIVGYILATAGEGLIDILRVGVDPTFRGVGIGQALLDKVLEGKSGPIMLTVKKDNENALKLYMKRGFRIVGVLQAEYGWVMKRQ